MSIQTLSHRLLLTTLTTAALTASSLLQAYDGDSHSLRLAHVVNTDDTYHIAAEHFRQYLDEHSAGKITVNIFPNASLGDERTLLEGMQIGTVDMGVITNGPVANFVPEFSVFELPFLFSSSEEAYGILDGEIGQEVLDRLEGVNLKGLAYAERGFRNVTNSQRAVHGPDDLDGLKLRVIENEVYADTFRTLGANAVPMAWTEALTALQQGIIDGQENPINAIHAFNLHETQSHLSLTRHIYAPAIFVMGMPAWQRLDEPAQALIQEAAQAAAVYAREQNSAMQAEQLEELRAAGMAVVEQPDRAAFQAAVQPVYEQYGERFGDYLPRIRQTLP